MHGGQTLGNFRSHAAEVDRFSLQRMTRRASQPQQVVDQLTKPLRLRSHPVKISTRLGIQLVFIVFQQRETPAVDSAQWRSQVVRDRIRESLELFVGDLQLRSAAL